MSASPQGSERNVTMQDIAEICGVTKVTVSRALRGESPRVSRETAERIRTVARDLGYDASSQHVARRLAMRKRGQRVHNHLIGVFMPAGMVDHPYYQRILAGIMDAAGENRYGVLLNYSNDSNIRIMPIYAQGDVDAILVMAGPGHFAKHLQGLRDLPGFGHRPVVFMVHRHPECPSVICNDDELAAAAAAHLLQLGHRHILHFNSETMGTMGLRLRGITQAVTEAGLDPQQVLTCRIWNYGNADKSRATLRQALADDPAISAILAPNDPGALVVADELQALGIRIPDDISLIGWDDTLPLLDDHGRNRLTTVEVPLREIGKQSMRLLIRQVESGDLSLDDDAIDGKWLITRGSLQVRATTGPAPRR